MNEDGDSEQDQASVVETHIAEFELEPGHMSQPNFSHKLSQAISLISSAQVELS
jgi:hypothetical protein